VGNLKPKARAARVIKFIEKLCYVPEGKFIGQPVKLRPWQKNEICKIYDNPAGTRRAFISFGRKNAKSTLAALLLLVHLCGPEFKRNGQLFSAAQSREQAALIFALAAKIVRMSPDLRQIVIIRDTAKELSCPELGTKYRALSAEASTAYGLSPAFIVHDELGQVRGPRSELYEALETATGAQESPLSVVISTQAPTDNDLLSLLIDDALARHDKRVTVSLYTAPKDADPFDEKTICLANPAFGDFLNAEEVMAMAEDARRMPAREAEFRNLVLNQRVNVDNPFIKQSSWNDCAGAVAKDWGNTPVYGGIDLSAVADLTAFVLIAKIDGCWHVRPTFWLPREGLENRSRQDHVPYDLWSREGFLEATPGQSVEYDWVAERIVALCQPLNVKKIAFDAWRFHHLRPALERAGFSQDYIAKTFTEFGQGYKSMSPALRVLESMVLNKRLRHGDHPVLKMCSANAIIHQDAAENRKLDKSKSTGRIDGMVALAMAAALAEGTDTPMPQYQMMVI